MNKRWISLLLPGLLLLSGCVTTVCHAADETAVNTAKETEVKKWSLEECILTALHNHGDVLSAEQAALSHKAALTQAKGDYFPTIMVQTMPLKFAGETIGNSTLPMSGTSVSVTQNVYDSGIREANVKNKLYTAKSSESSLQRQRETTANSVITSYYSAWLATRQKELQETTVKDLTGQLEMIHTRVEVGDAAKSDSFAGRGVIGQRKSRADFGKKQHQYPARCAAGCHGH